MHELLCPSCNTPSQWSKDLISQETVAEISDVEAITHSVSDLPWPATDRDAVLHNSLPPILIRLKVIEPFNSEAHVSLGVLQKTTGMFSKARASFLTALDHDPENAHARFNLALLTAEYLKEPNEALRLFHEVLQTESSTKNLKDLAKLHIDGLRETRILSQN